MSKKNIAVIFGSRSCEHEVSIITAIQFMENMDKEKYNVILPWYIMTSNQNHNETVSFFEYNKYFGYPEDWIVYDEEAEKYITNKSNYYYHLNHLNKSFSGKTTLEFDLLINEMTDHWHSVMSVSNSAGAGVLGLTYNNKNLRQGYKEDGTSYDSSSGKYFTLGKGKHHIRAEIGVNEWTNMRYP